ncbi:MAG: class 1 fructose-bisphosphatase [Geminicoccaceae bacterium]
MSQRETLQQHLDRWAGPDLLRQAVARTIAALAGAIVDISAMVAEGPLGGELGADIGGSGGGDTQKHLDAVTHRVFGEALAQAPVAVVGSEEDREPVILDAGAPLAVVIDPLDGSSNIDTNVPVGTIFGILPAAEPLAASVLRPGHDLLAAAFAIYGVHTALVLTLREGTHVFTLDRTRGQFLLTRAAVQIPPAQREYAINASNYRHWDEAIRTYVDDCIAGVSGPRAGNFNMRWIASLVAEAYRILGRGGIFLYPGDRRPGYEEGRLRLVYEANPMALLIEQAGGSATTGLFRILDLQPRDLHQRTPLVFGSADKVARVAGHYAGPPSTSERSPLFGRRGLFYHP